MVTGLIECLTRSQHCEGGVIRSQHREGGEDDSRREDLDGGRSRGKCFTFAATQLCPLETMFNLNSTLTCRTSSREGFLAFLQEDMLRCQALPATRWDNVDTVSLNWGVVCIDVLTLMKRPWCVLLRCTYV